MRTYFLRFLISSLSVHLPLITIPRAFIIIPSLLFTFRVYALYLAPADSAAKVSGSPAFNLPVLERRRHKNFKIGTVFCRKQDIILIKFPFLIRHVNYNVDS